MMGNMLTPGTLLQGRYRIVRQLAQGGMGTVYEATDERLETTVALKETSFDDEELKRQFEREARLLARLHHPALPRVSDHFNEDGGQFLVMQFVGGEDLEGIRRRQPGGAFPVAQVLAWADQLLDALEYLHTQTPPVIHRDIKPHNLKLGARGQIILLDFGLAKGYASRTSPLAAASSVVGYTPAYAPLEQIRGEGTDASSDLYSLAATLYHLLTGVVPSNALARADAVINGDPDPLRPADELSAQVSKDVSAVLRQALTLRRSQRISTATAMRRALREADKTPRPQAHAVGIATVAMPPQPTDPNRLDAATLRDAPPHDSEAGAHSETDKLSDTQRHHLEYWTAFRDYMERRGSFITPPKPQPQHLMIFPVGRNDFSLEVFNVTRPNGIGMRLVLKGANAKTHFYLLNREKEQIEKEIKASLQWQEKMSQKNSVINLVRYDVDPTNKQDWPRQHEWLLKNFEAFHEAFVPRIRNLKASDYVSGAGVEIEGAESGGFTHEVRSAAVPEVGSAGRSVVSSDSLPGASPPKKRGALLAGGLAALVLVALALGGFALYKFLPARDAGGGLPTSTATPAPRPAAATNLLKAHAQAASAVAFSPDGKALASGGWDGKFQLWDAETGALKWSKVETGAVVSGVAFSPDGGTLAIALYGSNGGSRVLFLETISGEPDAKTPALKGLDDIVGAIAFSTDGKRLFGTTGTHVKVWNLQTGDYENGFNGNSNPVFALSRDGSVLALASSNENDVKLYDTHTNLLLRTLAGHTKGVLAVSFSPTGQMLASGSYDGTTRLWDAATGASLQTLKENETDAAYAVAFSPDGQTVATGSNKTVRLWAARTGALKQTFSVEQQGIARALAFSFDGRTLAAGCENGAIVLFDLLQPPDAAKTAQQSEPSEQQKGGEQNSAHQPDTGPTPAVTPTPRDTVVRESPDRRRNPSVKARPPLSAEEIRRRERRRRYLYQ